MGNTASRSVEVRVRFVLAVLCGEVSISAAARREGTCGVSISKWRDLFLAGARRGLSGREQQLAVEVEGLNTALGEAHMELRLCKKGARCTRLRRF